MLHLETCWWGKPARRWPNHAWVEDMPSTKPWHQHYFPPSRLQYRIASCNHYWSSVVVKVANPPDIHVLASCCHVQSSVGMKLEWTVWMSRLKQQWKTYPMMKTTTYSLKHVLTSISIIFTRVASHLARSDTPIITCIVARLSRSDTPTLLWCPSGQ